MCFMISWVVYQPTTIISSGNLCRHQALWFQWPGRGSTCLAQQLIRTWTKHGASRIQAAERLGKIALGSQPNKFYMQRAMQFGFDLEPCLLTYPSSIFLSYIYPGIKHLCIRPNSWTQGVQWPFEKSLNFLLFVTISFVLIEVFSVQNLCMLITIFLYNVPTLLEASAWTTFLQPRAFTRALSYGTWRDHDV
jgi:hypothetical protein